MNDTLKYFSLDPVFRKFHHNRMTFSMLYAFTENFVLPISHDEVVHGKASLINKMPGDLWQQFANLRLLFGYMYGHPGKKMLFMGCEFGQREEWTETRSLEWHLLEYPQHRGMQRLVTDLNALLKREPAACTKWTSNGRALNGSIATTPTPASFPSNAARAIPATWWPSSRTSPPSFARTTAWACRSPGHYREIMNTDAEIYSGTNTGNLGGVNADPVPWNDRPYSLSLRLPPLAVVFFKLSR